MRGALGELPGEQSKVIELAYFGGFSQSEIARMLGVPLGTVKGRMRLGLGEDPRRAGGGTGMNENEHERWSEDVAAYLLGALEPGEAAELERHCRLRAAAGPSSRWLRPAVQLLPESVRAARAAAASCASG